MPLTDMQDLLQHARDHRHAVAAFTIETLDALDAIIGAAERCDAPLALAIDASRFERPRRARLLLAAMLAAARATSVPVALTLKGKADDDTVVAAIRHGCNGVCIGPGQEELGRRLRGDCGVAIGIASVIATGDRTTSFDDIEAVELTAGASEAEADAHLSRGVALLDFDAAPASDADRLIRLARGAGRASAALAACRPWSPVDHVIVYNVNGLDEAGVERMMAIGRARLGAIPGVLDVVTGRALTANAKFSYCWLVRFTHPAVIRSYAAHPDHAAFANELFRPIAGDRITIDFEAVGFGGGKRAGA